MGDSTVQTPQQFIAKWKASTLKERSAEADPIGEHFTFERDASKTGAGEE